MTDFCIYPRNGFCIFYHQTWQKDLKPIFQCECPNNRIWIQAAFATKTPGTKTPVGEELGNTGSKAF